MRSFLLVVALAAAVAAAQTLVYDSRDVGVDDVRLSSLPDGGCSAMWCGKVQSGGPETARYTCTLTTELNAGANRTACRTLLNAGVPRVQRDLSFAVDAGRP